MAWRATAGDHHRGCWPRAGAATRTADRRAVTPSFRMKGSNIARRRPGNPDPRILNGMRHFGRFALRVVVGSALAAASVPLGPVDLPAQETESGDSARQEPSPGTTRPVVYRMVIDGAISPASAEFLADAIATASQAGA